MFVELIHCSSVDLGHSKICSHETHPNSPCLTCGKDAVVNPEKTKLLENELPVAPIEEAQPRRCYTSTSNFFPQPSSYDCSETSAIVFNPAQSLHMRTNSDSIGPDQHDVPRSAHSFSSFEEIRRPLCVSQSKRRGKPNRRQRCQICRFRKGVVSHNCIRASKIDQQKYCSAHITWTRSLDQAHSK